MSISSRQPNQVTSPTSLLLLSSIYKKYANTFYLGWRGFEGQVRSDSQFDVFRLGTYYVR